MTKEELKTAVWNKLKEVIDWEIGLDVVTLGLVYDIQVDDQNNVKVLMTMTTPMCPLAGGIMSDAEMKIRTIEGVNNVEVELTFDPPWTPDRIDPIIRKQLGI
ncbi:MULTISPECIES: metal-sulfur cluster assembly factor [Fervidobacterium]|jgi:metal-sulfur cluster biosynthetic enzyme|uniref:Aromatic ring hydroxylase n=2 Tax=Fervidobacterium pennivorans TaxID=93466 RepID=A0A172T0W7_FERPE|nr:MULTISPECIES: metal-sulfur cluster assembly factor [Fervidobacterium]PHJ12647.1 aromatic ring hydroxylase [Fervidobacterium sp. SC_NGM5_O18]AFG35507.1 putative metal-sulfur cluster biosynthetic enzyme [Fervidobacterium pennivorans DSM 9078]ANE40637.1 aromatic ring hydroxylase [Fervidobacterium pennivorans]MDM7320211.1 metal-sulfur cluster assembly factor [Fervidobacterium sp.]NPU88710.1 metal-sulfur cluster assembly factor [Fervidobacterium sp.]